MKITLAPFGTASDVMPMLALARTLQSRGHVVTICAAEEFRSRIYECEVPMFSSGPTYRRYLECEGNLEDTTSALVSVLSEDMATHFVALRDGAREADVLIGGRLQVAGPSMAEQRGIPYLYAITTPGHADHDSFPIFGVPQNRAQQRRSKRIKEWNTDVLSALNRERKISHLPAVKNLFEHLFRSGPILMAVDPAFAPAKTLPNQVMTGYWYFNQQIDVSSEIEAYLNEPKAPIYIAPLRCDPKQILTMIQSLTNAGHRVVLGHGWEGIEEKDLPQDSQMISSLSYSHILPKMSVVVHSGNPDLAMHSIRAGVPQIIAPYTVEQTFWAQKGKEIGAALVLDSNGDIAKLQHTIQQVIADPSFSQRLKAMSPAPENGTEVAAEAIERAVEEHKNKATKSSAG